MIKLDKDKFILDAACGGRLFWFDKKHPNALYIDIRKRGAGHSKDRPNHEIKPDIIADFRELPFKDNSFKLVVWDPPHLINMSETSIYGRKYGSLNAETWPYDLNKGFNECWRVLETNGVLIFKWNETHITLKKILKQFPVKPLFGHPSGSKSKTFWLCFMKIP